MLTTLPPQLCPVLGKRTARAGGYRWLLNSVPSKGGNESLRMSDYSDYLDNDDLYQTPLRRGTNRRPLSANSRTSPSVRFSPEFYSSKSPSKVHRKEVEKIEELFADTKLELKKTSKEISDIEREHASEFARLKSVISDLKDRLNNSEEQVARLKSEKNSLELELEAKHERLQKAESALDIKNAMIKSRQQQIQELTEQIEELTLEKEDVLNKSHHELQDKDIELREKEQQLINKEHKLNLTEGKLRQQEADLDHANKLTRQQSAVIYELEGKTEGMETENARIKRQLEKAKEQLNELKSKKSQRLDWEIRFEQLKIDNARLVKLLQSTSQFTEFLKYNKENNGIAFVPTAPLTDEDLFGAPITYNPDSVERPIIPKGEWQYWIPQDAYDYARAFQNHYLPHVRDDLFHELLLKLNSVWHKKHVKKINELKDKHTEALRDLRRQMSHRQHYDDVINLERLDYLKKELRKAKSPSQSRLRDMEGSLLDTTLVTVENLSKEIDELRRRNSELRRSSLGSPSLSRTKDPTFLEGAAWMGRKVVDLADRLGDKISGISLDWQQKVLVESSRVTTSPQKMAKTQGSFLSSLERSVVSFREKLRLLFENVLQALDSGEELITSRKLELISSAREGDDPVS